MTASFVLCAFAREKAVTVGLDIATFSAGSASGTSLSSWARTAGAGFFSVSFVSVTFFEAFSLRIAFTALAFANAFFTGWASVWRKKKNPSSSMPFKMPTACASI